MNRILNKMVFVANRFIFTLKSLKKIYRYGGYTTVNITSIDHGLILKNKNILITGGSTGIGLEITKKCIGEGATVVITGRSEKKLKHAFKEVKNQRLKILVWDISKIAIIEDHIQKAEKLLNGSIDVLINNAGIIDGVGFPNITEEIWDRVYSTNSKGLFFLTQSLSKKWMKRNNNQQKKIINISSQGGFVGATYPYRMTKWDVVGLTQGLGIKLAPFGIIVNGIAPGIIATKMQPKFLKQNENIFCPLNPLQRFALPEEIAELAIFLISDSSNFIVGQTIVCDGGFSLK